MTDIKTYDPAQVLVVVAGLTITGFAQGAFVELTPAEASFRSDHGVDGEPARWASRNPFDTLVLTLAQTAPSNFVLSNLRNADLVTHTMVFPVLISDLNSAIPNSLYVAARGWITGAPSIGFGSNPTARRWSFDLLNTLYNVNGSDGAVAVSA